MATKQQEATTDVEVKEEVTKALAKMVKPGAKVKDKPMTDPKGKPKEKAPTVTRRATKFPDSHVIRVVKEDAPKRGVAADLFALYKKGAKGMAVGDYVAAVRAGKARQNAGRAAIAWDVAHGFITVTEV